MRIRAQLQATKLNGNGMVFEGNLFAERVRSFFGLEDRN